MKPKTQAICGACSGVEVVTPQTVENRSGLDRIAYRVGDHDRFRKTLLARLTAYPELAGLTTRDNDDFTIGLLDACAALGDVLTFYQERIANEHYLSTTTERRSALALARLVGYRLRPGVAADVQLAFTLEEAQHPGSAPEITLEAGLRVQSIPGPDEQAQSFETVEAIQARPEWNAMRPRQTRYQTFTHDTEQLRLEGLATGLKPGDGLILTDEGVSRLSIVEAVEPLSEEQVTRVDLTPIPPASPTTTAIGPILTAPPGGFEIIGNTVPPMVPIGATRAAALGPQEDERNFAVGAGAISGHTSATGTLATTTSDFGDVLHHTVSSSDLFATSLVEGFVLSDLFAHLSASAPAPKGVLALRTRASVFGHNAPEWRALPVNVRIGEYGPDPTHTGTSLPSTVFLPGAYANREDTWVDGNTLASYPFQGSATAVFLDNTYPQMTAGSFVAIKDGDGALVYQLDAVDEVSRSDFTLSAKVTRLTLDGGAGLNSFRIRNATVFGHSEELTLARVPIEEDVSGLVIELEGWVEGLHTDQQLIICGERADQIGVEHCAAAIIDRVDHLVDQEGYTQLTLKNALPHRLVRTSVRIHGNVARATHGEAVSEILGGGDPRIAWQSFMLSQPPLTYVSSADPKDAGARSTLEVRVDGVRWQRVDNFFGQSAEARIYSTRLDDDGNTQVMFGDGRTGARPPTGATNLRASYRKGIGSAGNVRAEQISLLLSRPLNLKEVINPLAANGGADAESLDEARVNIPLSVRTLGRVVSLSDYADFARSFAGVAKAHAAWVWDQGRRVLALSIAGTGDDHALGTALHDNLLGALVNAGDPTIPVVLLSYASTPIELRALLKIDPDYEVDTVLNHARTLVSSALAFQAREFGEPVAASHMITLLQAVEGVLAVDLDALHRALEPPARSSVLFAALPQTGKRGLQAAELLTLLDPDGLVLEVSP